MQMYFFDNHLCKVLMGKGRDYVVFSAGQPRQVGTQPGLREAWLR